MIIHGRNLIIKAGGVAIAAAKSCDISVQCEEIETAGPSTGEWRTAITGRKSWTVATNQLVMSIVRPFSMVGTSVSLNVSIEGEVGLPFGGFVDNVNASGTFSGSPQYIQGIFWDKTNKTFVLKVDVRGNIVYYTSWNVTGYPYDPADYTSPNDGDVFTYDSKNYVYLNGNLHAERLTGTANVVTWRVAGTVGNLAQGSFQFNGNGALTPASLPATT